MSVPTKWQLAEHWAVNADRQTYAPMLESLGHPCCFACGWFSERWSKTTPRSSWERATLERAHIIPSSLGGSDAPSNIVLLCAPCHRDAPDWHDASEMALWIATRPERGSKELEDADGWIQAFQAVPGFTALLEESEVGPDLPGDGASQRIVDLLWESTRQAGLHASALSQGTREAILRDATRRAAG